MSCGDVQIAECKDDPQIVSEFLAHWSKLGYAPDPPAPELVTIYGVAYNQYRMVHVRG
jgi:hypothetical protein